MQPGLVGFKELLQEFRGLSLWAVGGSVAVPFAAAIASLSPPWPPAIVLVTAVAELVALIYVYQFLRRSRRQTINKIIASSGLALVILAAVYLAAVSLYTYEVPTTKERFVKGYVCTEEAAAVFKQKCPDLGIEQLKTAEYDADRLWTARSITVVRLAIVGLWLAVFVALSVLVGSFLVFQLQEPGPRPRGAGEKADTVEVHTAFYHPADNSRTGQDVTALVQRLIKERGPSFLVDTNTFGDPFINLFKALTVEYTFRGVRTTKTIPQDQRFNVQ